MSVWRFPSKALLLPLLGFVLLVGIGADALRDAPAFGRLARRTVLCAAASGAIVLALRSWAGGLGAWTGIAASFWPHLVRVAGRDAVGGGLVAAAAVLTAFAVRRGALPPRAAAALTTALLAADLSRASAGLNRQIGPAFFERLPGLAARQAGVGRTFSYGLDHSPSYRAELQKGGREVTLGGTFAHRQILAPYTNMLDEVESPEAADLTAFAPRQREIGAELLAPARVADLLPWLRNAAVVRVLSVDRLRGAAIEEVGPALELLPGRLWAHVYRIVDPWPAAYVACRVGRAASIEEALQRPYVPGFAGARDVALEVAGSAGCRQGSVQRLEAVAGQERYRVDVDGHGYLVVRASYARGWRALVDGHPAPLLRANGKHRAVPVLAGGHEVLLRYHPPGLWAGGLVSSVSALVCGVLLIRGRAWRRRTAA
jgi:hypothetical protein